MQLVLLIALHPNHYNKKEFGISLVRKHHGLITNLEKVSCTIVVCVPFSGHLPDSKHGISHEKKRAYYYMSNRDSGLSFSNPQCTYGACTRKVKHIS